MKRLAPVLALALLVPTASWGQEEAKPLSFSEVLEAAPDSAWREVPADRLLVMDLAEGRVLIELAPEFAPKNVANVIALVKGGYFDGLAMIRSQENYVAQWGDPEEDEEKARGFGEAKDKVMVELDRPVEGLAFTALPDGDVYAEQVGFSRGFPAGREADRAWMVHCNATVGVARGNERDSGNGSSLYAVTGHAPRHLDRNITLIGRVLDGMEILTTLPRGSGRLGFYEGGEQGTAIERVRLASELPPEERPDWQVLRTETETFEQLVEARRNRHEDWFYHPVGRLELCNMPVPARQKPVAEGPPD